VGKCELYFSKLPLSPAAGQTNDCSPNLPQVQGKLVNSNQLADHLRVDRYGDFWLTTPSAVHRTAGGAVEGLTASRPYATPRGLEVPGWRRRVARALFDCSSLLDPLGEIVGRRPGDGPIRRHDHATRTVRADLGLARCSGVRQVRVSAAERHGSRDGAVGIWLVLQTASTISPSGRVRSRNTSNRRSARHGGGRTAPQARRGSRSLDAVPRTAPPRTMDGRMASVSQKSP